jgi:hypothetical protein
MEKLKAKSNVHLQHSQHKNTRRFVYKITIIYCSLKMAVFWDIAQCSLVEIYRRFRRPYSLNRQGDRPDDRGSRYL